MSQVLQVNGDYLVKVSDGGTITLDTGSGEVVSKGNLIVNKDLSVKGSVTLGSQNIDEIVVKGEILSNLTPKISNSYDLGGIQNYWRNLYVSRVTNPLGNLSITDLVEPSNPQDAATKNYVDTALGRAENVYYVSKSGNDTNDGRTLSRAKLTIKAAVEAARLDINQGYDATVFVKSGDYVEDNPIRLPKKLSIWGDTLRATTVRPRNKTQDLFWVTNGNYLAQMTFKDHEYPAAAVAFPPPTVDYPAVAIYQSPYTQNCTSITTTGCGMRVDGNYTLGLKSMVLDAYTQYNQGGIGIHMLNRGNTQLVSAFTINCDIAILCTAGGFCSLTNSNSSFGNFGLVADGISEPLYAGNLIGNPEGIVGDTIVLNNLIERPNVGDAISFNGSTNYYTVTSATELSAGDIAVTKPDFSNQPSDVRTVRQLILANRDKITTDTIDYTNETYKNLEYNQFKCTRDTNLIIEAAVDDLALGTNYKSIQAGMAYSRVSAEVVRNEQLPESLGALTFTRDQAVSLISGDDNAEQLENNFNLIYDLFSRASSSNPPTPPAYVFTPPVGAPQTRVNARDIILANRDFLIAEGIAYIESNLTFTYDKATCARDIGLIIDAIGYDLMFGSNFRSITAGRSYYRAQASKVVGVQKEATLDSFKFLRDTLLGLLTPDTEEYESVNDNMNLIIDILNNGLSAVPQSYTIPAPTSYDSGLENARDLIEANRDFIKAEVTEFIEQNYSDFVYDQSVCQRDIGLIIDALRYDLMFGSNFRSITAGRAYTRGTASVVTSAQKTATLDAFNFLKNKLVQLVSENSIAVTSITENINTIINIFNTGVSEVPSYVIPSPTNYNSGFKNARDLISNNRNFIKSEITAYIAYTYPSFTYDTVACLRDVDLILDAVYYDMTYGGNLETLIAGNAYYSFGSLVNTGEQTETLDTYARLKTVIIQIAQNISVTPTVGNTQSQTSGPAGNLAAANAAGQLIEDIRTIIATPESQPNSVSPSVTWVGLSLIESSTTLQSNKNRLKTEVTDYIDNIYGFKYDKSACQRDIDLILDAVYYDMTYGGNLETLIAGRAYYAFGTDIVNPGEESATLGTYAYMAGIILQIAQNVDIVELQSLVTQVMGTAGSSDAADFAVSLIEDIRTIIAQGPAPKVRYPDLRWVDPTKVAAHTLFQEEKDDTQRLVTNYIDSKYFLLDYNKSVCQRDIGLIIDAVAYDLMFGSNFRTITAGRAYARGTASVVSTTQRSATIDAFNKLKEILIPIVNEEGDASSSNTVSDLMDLLLTILTNGVDSVPEYVIPEPIGYSSDRKKARDLIDNNRDFIKAEVIEFINQNYSFLDYDQETCARDIGLIIDAVGYDMMFGSNFRSITAGRSYYRAQASLVIGSQKQATIDSFTYLKGLLLRLVVNNTAAVDSITGNLDLIIDILDNGLTSVPGYVIPNPTGYDVGFQNARNLIAANRSFIKSKVITYIGATYPSFSYNQSVCQRDIDLILDAVYYDMTYRGNLETLIAGKAYYSFGTLVNPGEKTQTLDAYAYMKTLIIDVAKNLAAGQVSGTAGTTDAAIFAGDLIEDIRSLINQVEPTVDLPSTLWVSSDLRNLFNTIQDEKITVSGKVTDYINSNFALTYNQESCTRDMDLIFDAVYYDMTYGGNLETLIAGRAYYSFNQIVNPGEETATVAAYGYMKNLFESVAQSILVSSPLQIAEPQILGSGSTITGAQEAKQLIENIRTIILTPDSEPSEVTPDLSWVEPILVARASLLTDAKETAKTQVTDFIDSRYNTNVVPFTYDSEKCKRDVGLIVDALAWDMMFGSNFRSITAGRSYYRGNASVVLDRQKQATIEAYEILKEFVVGLISENQQAVESVENNLDLIIDIFDQGLTAVPEYNIPEPVGYDTGIKNARNLIEANREFIKEEVVRYISNIQLSSLNYDKQKCQRDIGLIIDAVGYDMMFGSNFRSITAGRSYLRQAANLVTSVQKQATLDSFRYLKSLLLTQAAGSLDAIGIVTERMDLIIDIIDQGLSAVPSYVLPNPTGFDAGTGYARDLIVANKEFIKAEITAWIDYNYVNFDSHYDSVTCQRDIGLIIDAVTYDLITGSNFASTVAGSAYYRIQSATVTGSQLLQTLEAVRYAKTLAVNYVVSSLQTRVSAAFDNVLNILENGLSATPTLTFPDNGTSTTQTVSYGSTLRSNKASFQNGVANYLNINYTSVWNGLGTEGQAICKRDVGYIVDAVSYDVQYGGNYQSIIAGEAYYSFGTLQIASGEKAATLAAYEQLKTLMQAAVPAASTAIGNLIDNIKTTINTGTSPATTYPSALGETLTVQGGVAALQGNSSTIQTNVTTFITDTFSSLDGYDIEKCERDVGYIIDAIAYDITYGGNLETIVASLSYYVGATAQYGAGEKSATVNAYRYMKLIIEQIAKNVSVPTFQSPVIVSQTTGTAGSEEAATAIGELVQTVIDYINTEVTPTAIEPNTDWVSLVYTSRFALFQDNKEDFKFNVTDYIDKYYSFSYDRATCQRDVGLVLDAVGYDIMFGSNFRAITAGRSYYRAGAAVVTELQKEATLDAFRYLKGLILSKVSNNPTAVSRAETSMNIILNILENGLSSVPTVVLPNPTGYDVGYERARNLIEANRSFIKSEISAYIAYTYPGFTYDTVACLRDVDLILDAVRYDMTYGGNMETIIAGNAYYSFGNIVNDGEQTETLDTYNRLKAIIIQIAQNISIVRTTGNTQSQVSGIAGTFAAADYAGQLIENIRTIISTPETPPATSLAGTTWVQAALVNKYNILQDSKNLIAGQVTSYIDAEYVEPNYNQDKCKRDIEYILDAVYYDMTYGGNMETAIAANSYFVGTNIVIPGEVEATVDAYNYMKNIMANIATNTPVVSLQSEISQTFGTAGSSEGAQIASDLIENIRTVISTGELLTAPTEANKSWVNSNLVDLYDTLQDQRQNAKIAVADFIDSKYFLLTYNREICKRDIGFIIDALSYDVAFNSNFRSIVAARSYYRTSTQIVINAQKSAMIGSLRRLKEIILISSQGDEDITSRVTDLINLMVKIVDEGISAIPEYDIPNPTNITTGYSNARSLVEQNRDFVKAQVAKYIEVTYPEINETYNQELCLRDVDYILDAVYYDITYSTNAESIVAGRSYYSGNSYQFGQNEFAATIGAYEYMKGILEQIALNNSVTQLGTEPQIFGSAGSSEASLAIGALIQTIIDYITTPTVSPEVIAPDLSWINSKYSNFYNSLESIKEPVKTTIQQFIDAKYSYSQATCSRDIGYMLDACIYDILYGGNSQVSAAAATYYGGGVFRIGGRERLMTANTFKYLKTVVGSCLLNIEVTPLQNTFAQDTDNQAAGVDEIIKSNELFTIVAEVVENGFTSNVVLNENIPDFDPIYPNIPVTFHQYSLITASGQTFEWVGAGTNVNTSLPYLGGIPLADNKAVETNGGKVYWTGTDQFGDFNIGGELVIRRDSGTIEGRTFTKSLFAVLTPYILAVGE